MRKKMRRRNRLDEETSNRRSERSFYPPRGRVERRQPATCELALEASSASIFTREPWFEEKREEIEEEKTGVT